MTACRAGLLLMSDPRAADAALRVDPKSLAHASGKDRVEDLVRFVVTDDYYALRQAIGVEVA
jgi:hypothetical protein